MINHNFFIFTAPLEDVSDISASDAYSQVVGKAEELWTTMINEMGADACRKADTYTICVGNAWGIAFNSQVDIVCIPPHKLAPAQHSCEVPDGSIDRS